MGGMLQSLIIILILGISTAFGASPKSVSADRMATAKYRGQCLNIKKYFIKTKYSVDCFTNYQHFNSKALKSYSKTKAKSKGTVKIASYNMLHPGSLRSMFKDTALMAKMMNNWDIVVALELLPVVGRDLKHNLKVLKALSKSKAKKYKDLYRVPGYVHILDELRKLDKSWALLLSPRGDSAKSGQVEELVGFFYKAKNVRPITNDHCDEYKPKGSGRAYGCFPNFRKSFMGRETTHVFSRRPFLASFESGNFDFSLLGSHVIFGSPADKTEMKKILKASFNVTDYKDLGTGVTKGTYARFAEVAVTLEFMENLKYYYNEDDLIYAGDFNLTPENKFWKVALKRHPGAKLYQKQASTVSQKRDDNGSPTGGLSSSYDHFIMNPKELTECATKSGKMRVSRFNVFKGATNTYIKKNYIIRKAGSLSQTSSGKQKREYHLKQFSTYLKSIYTIKAGKIVWDDYKFSERVKTYDARLFASQLKTKTYHKVQQELLSDHMPVLLNCSTK